MNRVYQSGNVELREEDNGDVVLENTATNETVTLSGSFEEVVAAVNNHAENDVHTQNQPNQSHDNEDHDRDFVDETEAANAAPTQSVFGRVGDVVAEANDYAATQIQNFGSEVISTIDGTSISPSDISNLWDGQNVTADVDNQSVSTEDARIKQLGQLSVHTGEFSTVQEAIDYADTNNIHRVVVEPGVYDEGITVKSGIELTGGFHSAGETEFRAPDSNSAGIALEDRSAVKNISYSGVGDGVHINGTRAYLVDVYQRVSDGDGIVVKNDNAILQRLTRIGGAGGDHITFESGTSGGIVDTCVATGTIVDNGSNFVGDIS